MTLLLHTKDMVKRVMFVATIGAMVLGCIYVIVAKNSQQKTVSMSQVPQEVQQVAQAQEQERTVVSLDGTKKLTMKEQIHEDSHTYSFYIDNNTTQLFAKTVPQGVTMNIPDNAWAPGDKYVFLEESNGTGTPNYFVLKTDGTPFATGQYLKNVTELFNAKNFTYKLKDATGWADPTLLMLHTTKDTGEKGSSYWFVVESSEFMQLYR